MPDAEELRGLYPETTPFSAGRLAVGGGHELHYEQYGNPEGVPALFVHGGPGGGTTRAQSRFWNPETYRVVLFDQRGAGKSTPHACLEDNTTWHLVQDMERLRAHLGIDRWQIFGGSWGSTLALAYAQRHPERVTALVLRGVFLARRQEIRWFYQEGASRLFPEAWQGFVAPIPAAERGDLVRAYHRRLTGDDVEVRMQAAQAWTRWEASTSTLIPSSGMLQAMSRPEFALAFARIECHYFVHDAFLERDDQLLSGMDRLGHVPGIIVQGRYDVVCPAQSAWELHRAWPGSRLVLAERAGHSAFEPEILRQLVKATDELACER